MTSIEAKRPDWTAEGGTATSAPTWASQQRGESWVGLASTLSASSEGVEDAERSDDEVALGRLYKQAYEEGIARAKSTVTALIDRYHNAIAELGVLRERIVRESEEELALLALHIAEQVMGSDQDAMLELTLAMVQESLAQLTGADKITLRVAPTDVRAIESRFPGLCDGGAVSVVPDETIGLGGVVAECDFGRVDGTFRRRLEQVRRQLTGSQDGGGSE